MNCKNNKESTKYLQYTSIVPFCVHQKPSEVLLCPRILQNHSPLDDHLRRWTRHVLSFINLEERASRREKELKAQELLS